MDTLKKMESANAVRGLGAVQFTKKVGSVCEECGDGEAMNKPYPPHEKSTKNVLELMQADLSGPMNRKGLNGEKYMQLLVDDYSGAMWVSSLKTKADATHGTK